jgi:hypothetical protein
MMPTIGTPDFSTSTRTRPLEKLLREERAAGFDPDPLERVALEQLARAVDVADADSEPDAVREPVQPSIEHPDRGVWKAAIGVPASQVLRLPKTR